MNNETKNFKRLSFEDERPIVVSDETRNVLNLILATNELYNRVYNVVGYYYPLNVDSQDNYFQKEFSGSFAKLSDSLYKLLGEAIYESLGETKNVTDDLIKI